MGGLHGDMDRDLKDTNLIVLSNDVAKLHARMETLMAALKAQVRNHWLLPLELEKQWVKHKLFLLSIW